MNEMSIIERAYELARTGEFAELDYLRRTLKREGYEAVDLHLSGSLARELRETSNKARALKL